MNFRFAFVLAGLILCAGCVPFKTYDLPSVRGMIRDGETQAPIARAQIRIAEKEKNGVQREVMSDKLGNFDVPEVTHTVWLPPLPFDPVSPDCIIQVSASGYLEQDIDYYDYIRALRERSAVDSVEIDLKHS